MRKYTPWTKINKYVYKKNIFETIESAEKYIRRYKAPDLIAIDNILYTMDEYDFSGKDITYGSKRTGNAIFVRTEDRYKKGFGDAKIELIENYGVWRNDITYYD